MEGLICREATPDDVGDVLAVRNAIFPPLTEQQWFADPTMTCAMAYLDGEPVGAIPLSQRSFQVAPGVAIETAFENAVGTRDNMRSKGVGTAVINAAKEFLAGRCDELMVYRGAERSPGYRFYERSGHKDLLYLRSLTLDEPRRRETDTEVQGLPEIHALQPELLGCFNATYGKCGGFPVRHKTYWEQQLASQIYEVIPQDTFLVRVPAAGALRAYAIGGISKHTDRDRPLTIAEVAGHGEADVETALLGIEDLAKQHGRGVVVRGSSDHPLLPLFRKLGYSESLRHTMIMGQPLDPAGLFGKVCADAGALDELKIDFWAPFADGTLYEGPNAKTEITLEGKDEVITRLLNRRLDVRAACATELLTIRNGTADIVERLTTALPYSPWVYHAIDYV